MDLIKQFNMFWDREFHKMCIKGINTKLYSILKKIKQNFQIINALNAKVLDILLGDNDRVMMVARITHSSITN